jgi:hypothetical protein
MGWPTILLLRGVNSDEYIKFELCMPEVRFEHVRDIRDEGDGRISYKSVRRPIEEIHNCDVHQV